MEKILKEIKEHAGVLLPDKPAQKFLLVKEIELLESKKKTSVASVVECLEESTHEEAKRYIEKLNKLDRSFSSTAKKKRSKKSKRVPSSDLDSPSPITWVAVTTLKFDEKIKNFFFQDPKKIARISEDMKKNGFDERFPLFVWECDGEYIIYDGNGRFQAALKAGLKKVPVIFNKFGSRLECMLEGIWLQGSRRNLSKYECFKIIQYLSEFESKKAKKNQGARTDLSTSGSRDLEVAGNKALALKIKLSESSVKRIKKIIQYPDLEKLVCEQGLSIRKVYGMAIKREKEQKAVKTNTSLPDLTKTNEPVLSVPPDSTKGLKSESRTIASEVNGETKVPEKTQLSSTITVTAGRLRQMLENVTPGTELEIPISLKEKLLNRK